MSVNRSPMGFLISSSKACRIDSVSSMQYLLSSEESLVATLFRSKMARNSGDLAPIHLLSSIRSSSQRPWPGEAMPP